jgi:hypothetical protein
MNVCIAIINNKNNYYYYNYIVKNISVKKIFCRASVSGGRILSKFLSFFRSYIFRK